MVTIVKGKEKIVCTRETYEEQYKNLGYREASENEKEAVVETASSFEEKQTKNDEEDEKEKLSTKYGLKSKKSATTKKEEK